MLPVVHQLADGRRPRAPGVCPVDDAPDHLVGAGILGVGRLCKAHGRNEAEFAVVVSDQWQRRGLGTLLLTKLVEIGREERLARITGTVLAENQGMRRVCEHVGFDVHREPGEQEFEASITP